MIEIIARIGKFFFGVPYYLFMRIRAVFYGLKIERYKAFLGIECGLLEKYNEGLTENDRQFFEIYGTETEHFWFFAEFQCKSCKTASVFRICTRRDPHTSGRYCVWCGKGYAHGEVPKNLKHLLPQKQPRQQEPIQNAR